MVLGAGSTPAQGTIIYLLKVKIMEDIFKVGNILEDTATKERFKVLKVDGDLPFAYITLLHLKYDLKYGNFANQLSGMVLI